MKIKICGITNLEDAVSAVDLGADALGFVFCKSPRQISPEVAKRIINELPVFINSVGVFVNAPKKEVERSLKVCRIDTLQFHGDENPDYCVYFRRFKKVIKAFRVRGIHSSKTPSSSSFPYGDKLPLWGEEELEKISWYDVDGYLLDAYKKDVYGGTGAVFDWNLAREAKKLAAPVILSGGLNPENVREAIGMVKPYAVDVSTGVEKKPGKKDLKLMREFIRIIKECHCEEPRTK